MYIAYFLYVGANPHHVFGGSCMAPPRISKAFVKKFQNILCPYKGPGNVFTPRKSFHPATRCASKKGLSPSQLVT
jgi:hypothetical protein